MTNRKRQTTLSLGVISEATLRLEDLIPALLWDVRRLRLSRQERIDVSAIDRRNADDYQTLPDGETEDDARQFDYERLTEIAENHLPDYSYFGSTDGDGACIGVWPSLDAAVEEFDRVAELPAIVKGYSPSHVLQVSDHGNATLYRRAGNRWIEVWSVV